MAYFGHFFLLTGGRGQVGSRASDGGGGQMIPHAPLDAATVPRVKKKITVKGALDKYIIIPQLFFGKSWDFYTIKSVGMGNDCMLSFTF